MQAARIHHYRDNLRLETIPRPTIGPKDVLVQVVAASLNPIDLKTKDGKLKMLLKYEMPLTLGSDFAGIVTAVGVKVKNFAIGDPVYGRVQKNRIGTFAEYLAVAETDIALKPSNLTFAEAAAIPLVGLTSYQALHEIMKIKPNDKVLIQAGSGGIGTIAIQLAKLAGAYVATTTSAKNTELVRSLGADLVIDYRQQDFSEILADYDYVFDTQGGDILAKAFKIIKPQGKVVSISGLPNLQFAKDYDLSLGKQILFALAGTKLNRLAQKAQATYHFLFMRPDGKQLETLSQLLEAEKLRPVIDSVIPFDQLQTAVEKSTAGHAVGKIILAIDPELASNY